jgi:hypothetical protein
MHPMVYFASLGHSGPIVRYNEGLLYLFCVDVLLLFTDAKVSL